ncbi:hypothetical protein BH09MYX1_BH09MYX1_02120 [soil metagenome]
MKPISASLCESLHPDVTNDSLRLEVLGHQVHPLGPTEGSRRYALDERAPPRLGKIRRPTLIPRGGRLPPIRDERLEIAKRERPKNHANRRDHGCWKAVSQFPKSEPAMPPRREAPAFPASRAIVLATLRRSTRSSGRGSRFAAWRVHRLTLEGALLHGLLPFARTLRESRWAVASIARGARGTCGCRGERARTERENDPSVRHLELRAKGFHAQITKHLSTESAPSPSSSDTATRSP